MTRKYPWICTIKIIDDHIILAQQIKSLFRQNRSLCGTSIKVGMGTPLGVLV